MILGALERIWLSSTVSFVYSKGGAAQDMLPGRHLA